MELNFGEMCLAALDKGAGGLDFRACLYRRNSSGNNKRTGATECTANTHVDVSSSKLKLRLWYMDPIGIFAIDAPQSNSTVVYKSCFLRPVFELSKFPWSLRQMDRHMILLDLDAKLRTLKFILEGYPGENLIWQMSSGILLPRPSSPLANPRSRDEVLEAPGVEFTIRPLQTQSSVIYTELGNQEEDRRPPRPHTSFG